MKPVPAHVPAVAKPRALRIPDPVERKLRNGLRAVVVKKPGVPRAELRLRIPAGLIRDRGDAGRARVMPETLLAGTADRSEMDIATELQRLGATISAGADTDDLVIAGGTLSASLDRFLGLLAEVVMKPSFPSQEVAIARDRVAQEILIMSSEPQVIASQAWRARVFGRHPYARGYPKPEAIRKIGRAAVAGFHEKNVLPRGSTLVLVGDVQPARALDRIEEVFGKWKGAKQDAPAAPGAFPSGMPSLIVDRPGAVQTNIRIVGPAVARADADYDALALANTIFGGYFSSRLIMNIREDKGYTYSPGSMFDRRRLATSFVVAADVATDVTAPALHEIHYELGRIASLPVGDDEFASARRYLAGVTTLQVQTQAGLVTMLDSLLSEGLGVDWLRGFAPRLEALTTQDVLAAARRYLAPRGLTTILVGDAGAIEPSVAALDPVEVRRAI